MLLLNIEDTNNSSSPNEESKLFRNELQSAYNFLYKQPAPYNNYFSSPNYINMKRNRYNDFFHFPSRTSPSLYHQNLSNQYLNSKVNSYNDLYSRNDCEYYDGKINIFDEFDKEYDRINNNRYCDNNLNDIINNNSPMGLPLPFNNRITSNRTKEDYLFK